MAELITVQTAAAASADFSLGATDVATLSIKGASDGAPDGAEVAIQIKSGASGTYTTIGYLNKSIPAQVLAAPGTYRVTKQVSTNAYGVDQA